MWNAIEYTDSFVLQCINKMQDYGNDDNSRCLYVCHIAEPHDTEHTAHTVTVHVVALIHCLLVGDVGDEGLTAWCWR